MSATTQPAPAIAEWNRSSDLAAVRADSALGEFAEPPRLQVSLWDNYNAALILEQRRYNMSL